MELEEEGSLSDVSSVVEVSRHLVANSLSPNSSDNKRSSAWSEEKANKIGKRLDFADKCLKGLSLEILKGINDRLNKEARRSTRKNIGKLTKKYDGS